MFNKFRDFKPTVIFWGPDNPDSEDIAKRLNASLHFVHFLRHKVPVLAPIKYPFMFLKTLYLLFRERPSVVYVINTPVFAPLCVYLYHLLTGTPFVMNVHGHSYIGKKWGWAAPLQRFLAKRALTNVVDHAGQQRIFQSWGGDTIMMERPPFVLYENDRQINANMPFAVTVISNFHNDEPLHLVIEAARQLPDIRIFILGNTARAEKEMLESAPENVIFPGYLYKQDYWRQLYASNAIMTLTTSSYSLVAGGIEGMAVGKPLILSRQPVLTEYFSKGTVFVEHTVESIANGIHAAQLNESQLLAEIAALSGEKQDRWNSAFQELVVLMGGERCSSSLISA